MAGAVEQRGYAAAGNSRLVGDWNAHNLSANQEVKGGIKALRARGRSLARDNDYFIGFLKKLDANVIGTAGIRLQVDAKKADGSKKEAINRGVEEQFKSWGLKKNCDATGQSSFRDLAGLALRTLATEGEFLIRYIIDPTSEYGFKLQMLDVDWLDEDFNDPQHYSAQSNFGNRIVMSVELDRFDKPVAYWFTTPKYNTISVPGVSVVPNNSPQGRLRVPAEQVMHRFLKERPGQTRGVTWTHGSMLSMNMLDGFDEAELVGARVGASNMAFVSPPTDDSGGGLGNRAEGEISTEVSPGQILELPAGYTVHEFTPPKQADGDFSKRMLRKIATSLGISYSSLTSDLTDVNFSSIRAGTIEEREIWRVLQTWMAEHFYQDIFEKFLLLARHTIPAGVITQVMNPVWRGRGFQWVDPQKDVTASVAALDRGLKTMTEILAEDGKDFEETMDQHAYEKKYIESLDLQFASPDTQAQIAADQADAAANADDKSTADKKKKEGKK